MFQLCQLWSLVNVLGFRKDLNFPCLGEFRILIQPHSLLLNFEQQTCVWI